MELPENSEGPPEDGELDEAPVPVWPPRISDPPRLPYVEAEYMGLELDPLGKAPEPPDFTPARLTRGPSSQITPRAQVGSAGEQATSGPAAVVYDRRNPSGRTRGDKVLRPTPEDRLERLWRKRRGAALMGALAAGCVALILASLSPVQFALVIVAAALAGWAAYDLGDTEVTWAACMWLVGLPVGWNYDVGGILISSLFMAGAGWFTGFVRDADLS